MRLAQAACRSTPLCVHFLLYHPALRAGLNWGIHNFTMPKLKLTVAERIEQSIIGPLDDNLCWETHHKSNSSGHVSITIGSHKYMLHRLAWELHNAAPIPEGMCVLHKCDNPRCCNPSHLFLGTIKDNTHDMVNKNRYAPKARGCYFRPECGNRYEAKLIHQGKRIHIGFYDTEAEAHAAYINKRKELSERSGSAAE